MSINDYFGIIRPLNCIIAALGVFVGFSLADQVLMFSLPLGLGMIAAFLVTAGGNVINDYFDVSIDKRLGKNNLIALGKITEKAGLVYSLGLFLAGIAVAYLINETTFFIAIVVTFLLIVYSAFMKKKKFYGNFVIAFGTALTLVFGASIVQKYDLIIFLAASAFFANLGREITKDLEDLEGDRGIKTTLPMIMHSKEIDKIVIGVYALGVGFSVSAWTLRLITGPYFVLFLIGSAALFFHSWELLKKKKFMASQKQSKFGMILGLIAFLAGVI